MITTISITLLALSVFVCSFNMYRVAKRKNEIKRLFNVLANCMISSHALIGELLGLLRQHHSDMATTNAWVLACLRPYIIAIQRKAVDREDYEEAKQCQHIISEIDKLINKTKMQKNSSY